VKKYKPAPEVYLSAPEIFDLTPAEVMMVAAHREDLEVPRRLGMKTAFILRSSRESAQREPFDVVARDLNDLATRLGL
jgi:2-haloacid dehalogenase